METDRPLEPCASPSLRDADSASPLGDGLALATRRVSLLRTLLRYSLLLLIVMFLALLLTPIGRMGMGSNRAARRIHCASNLRQIAAALNAYAWRYQAFPPAFTVDASGRPLHSWRTLILPFLDEQKLYGQIDLNQPWDAPVNQKVGKLMPRLCACPEVASETGRTCYVVVVGEETCFPGGRARPLVEIKDGSVFTIMVVEVSEEAAVPWMAPQDITLAGWREDLELPSNHRGGNHIAFKDGSINHIDGETPVQVLAALTTVAGDDNEVVNKFFTDYVYK